MDEIIKDLIIGNKLTLTLLAMVFTPVGLFAGWRALRREPPQGAAVDAAADRRLAAIEVTLDTLVEEIAQMREEQQRVASALERDRLAAPRHTAPSRLPTPT